MDLAALMTAPVIITVIVIIALSVWIGHILGKSQEEQRKTQALQEAEQASLSAMDELRQQNTEKLDVLAKASANDLEQLKTAHTRQIDQVNTAHQTLVDSLKATHLSEIERMTTDHSSLVDRLNATNNANINEIEKRREAEIQAIKDENANVVASLKAEQQSARETMRNEHEQALARVNEERDRRLEELAQRNREETERLNGVVSDLTVQREQHLESIKELETTLSELREEVKEAKLNNMFSVSKSGEKLIRVVRSVQELATELDDTSRTVTGGEYSFFDQIKDSRDRDAVLRLAGDDNVAFGAEPAEVAADEQPEDAPVVDAAADENEAEKPGDTSSA
jgi:chromosome segregation ATPase